jgi:hypothetical protein
VLGLNFLIFSTLLIFSVNSVKVNLLNREKIKNREIGIEIEIYRISWFVSTLPTQILLFSIGFQ